MIHKFSFWKVGHNLGFSGFNAKNSDMSNLIVNIYMFLKTSETVLWDIYEIYEIYHHPGAQKGSGIGIFSRITGEKYKKIKNLTHHCREKNEQKHQNYQNLTAEEKDQFINTSVLKHVGCHFISNYTLKPKLVEYSHAWAFSAAAFASAINIM